MSTRVDITVRASYYGNDPYLTLDYFSKIPGVFAMSMEPRAAYGGPVCWEMVFRTNKSGYDLLMSECDKQCMVVEHVEIDQPTPLPLYSFDYPGSVSYVTKPADKTAMTLQQYANVQQSEKEWLEKNLQMMYDCQPVPDMVVSSSKRPKTKEPADTGRCFDMDFDNSDLT